MIRSIDITIDYFINCIKHFYQALMSIIEYNEPFYHAIVDDVFSEEELAEISKLYNNFAFREIHTDLFRFLQTGELAEQPEIKIFEKKLVDVFSRYPIPDQRYFNIFASYYRNGDYLLCHDDLVDARVYAFTFYLEDFESGKLVMFDNDMVTIAKQITVKKNRMVIFKVGTESFHEVDLCKADGRKAISGWLNSPGFKHTPKERNMSLRLPNNLLHYKIDLELPSVDNIPSELKDNDIPPEQMLAVEIPKFPYTILAEKVLGPFISRRCTEIISDSLYAPIFDGYECVHAEYLKIEPHGYILCNDAINMYSADMLDVFDFDETSASVPNYISYARANGEKAFGLDAVPGITLLCIEWITLYV